MTGPIKEESPGRWIWNLGGIRRGPVATREAAQAIDAIMQAALARKHRWPSNVAVMDALRAMPELEGKITAPTSDRPQFGPATYGRTPGM